MEKGVTGVINWGRNKCFPMIRESDILFPVEGTVAYPVKAAHYIVLPEKL